MKLIKVRNTTGSDYFINPACIEAVGPTTDGQTKIYMRGDNYFTATPVEDIARMIEGEGSAPVGGARRIAELEAKLREWENAARPDFVTWIDQYYQVEATPEGLSNAIVHVQGWIKNSQIQASQLNKRIAELESELAKARSLIRELRDAILTKFEEAY